MGDSRSLEDAADRDGHSKAGSEAGSSDSPRASGFARRLLSFCAAAHVLDTRDAADSAVVETQPRRSRAMQPLQPRQPAVAAISNPSRNRPIPDRTEIAAHTARRKKRPPDPITQPRVQQAPARPGGPPATSTPGADRFALAPPPAATPSPYSSCRRNRGSHSRTSRSRNRSHASTHRRCCAINRSLNTALTWAKSPAEAAEQANREGKLVFLIHVSGNFEDPGFT